MPISWEITCKSFWTLNRMTKMIIWYSFQRVYIKNLAAPPPSFFCRYSTDHLKAREQFDIRRSAILARCPTTFQPLALCQAACGMLWILCWISSLAFSQWRSRGILFWDNSTQDPNWYRATYITHLVTTMRGNLRLKVYFLVHPRIDIWRSSWTMV